jgi:hypothetical protein
MIDISPLRKEWATALEKQTVIKLPATFPIYMELGVH